MAVEVIDKIKPKNGGSFPVVEAEDVAVSDELRLPEALAAKADVSALAETDAAVATKADASAVATVTADLQGQINQIEISATAESVVAPEVAGARVGADSTSYTTLKERLDAEYDSLNSDYISSQTKSAFQALVVSHEMYSTTGRASSTSTIVDSYRTEIVPCSEGEEFEYFGRCDVNYAAVVWFNGDSLISYEQTTETHAAKYTFTAPANATKCAFSSYSTDKFYVCSKSRAVIGNVSKSIDDANMGILSNRSDIQTIGNFVHSVLYNTENLFDKNSAEITKRAYISASGIVTDPYEGASISHWIQVREGVSYKFNADNFFGTSTNNLLFSKIADLQTASRFKGTIVEEGNDKYVTFTAEGDGYVKFNQSLAIANGQMFCVASEYPDHYIPYKVILDDSVKIPDTDASSIQGLIGKNQVDFISHEKTANLFDVASIVEGSYLMPTDGRIETNANCFYALVPVFVGEFTLMVNTLIYGQSNGLQLPLYDENYDYVGVISGTSPTSTNVKAQEAHFELTEEKLLLTGAKYFGYSSYIEIKDTLMIVQGEEYPEEYIPHVDRYFLEGVEAADSIDTDELSKNPLNGKKVVFDGDSICQATSEGTIGMNGWPYRIGTDNHMDWHNVGVNGGTITAELYAGGVARHWISRYISTIYSNYPTLDYLILEGGTNDADLLKSDLPESLGELDYSDYSGEYDDTTFTGALESLFYKALSYYKDSKIGFIIAPKMGVLGSTGDYTKENNNRRYFFERIIEVCNKWGIPYINLWDDAPLNPTLPFYYNKSLDAAGNRENGYAYTDGQHLTGVGYDIISSKIAAWMMSL